MHTTCTMAHTINFKALIFYWELTGFVFNFHSKATSLISFRIQYVNALWILNNTESMSVSVCYILTCLSCNVFKKIYCWIPLTVFKHSQKYFTSYLHVFFQLQTYLKVEKAICYSSNINSLLSNGSSKALRYLICQATRTEFGTLL